MHEDEGQGSDPPASPPRREVNGTASPDSNDATVTKPRSAAEPVHFGNFRIVRRLGEGGMGIVYEAEQQHPKRPVALKVIRGGGHVDDAYVRMFRREVQTLARLRHPGIAAIYESGCTQEGQHFFAMELVRGETLGDYLQHRSPEGSLSAAEVEVRLALFRRICDAINYAHQRGVIHRDLKPANVLVLREGPVPALPGRSSIVPEIKILDFGLARITDSDVAFSTVLTDLGSVLGTLPFMSPEQVRGNPDEIDLRTDVYALGVILYTMLAGQLPLDVERRQLPEAVRIICEEPPRPLARTWRGVRKLDSDLATIVHTALEKEPARRYQSAAALSEDIQRFLTDQPILARPPSTVYQIRKLVARHKAPFAFVGAFFLLLAGVAAVMSVQAGRIARERDRANREAATASQVAEFLVGLFKVNDPSEARGNTISAREVLDKGAQSIDRDLQGEPAVRAKLLGTMGRVYQSLGLYKRAEPMLQRSLEIRAAVFGEESLEHAESLHDLGDLYGTMGQLARASPLHEQALAIREKLLPAEDPAIAKSLWYLGTTHTVAGHDATGIPYLERALASFEKSPGNHALPMSWCLTDLGNAWREKREFGKARQAFERALHLKESELTPDHPDVAISLNNLGYLLTQMGDYEEAAPLLERALGSMEKNFGRDHAHTAMVMQSLGEMWWRAGKPETALPLLKSALSIQEKTLAPEHPDIPLTHFTLAVVYRDLERYAEAEACFQRALSLREQILPPNHPDINETMNEYAKLLFATGRKAEADRLEARARSTPSPSPDRPNSP